MWRLHVDAATRLADALLPRMAALGRRRLVLTGSRVAFLLSPPAAAITGQEIQVCGGASLAR